MIELAGKWLQTRYSHRDWRMARSGDGSLILSGQKADRHGELTTLLIVVDHDSLHGFIIFGEGEDPVPLCEQSLIHYPEDLVKFDHQLQAEILDMLSTSEWLADLVD